MIILNSTDLKKKCSGVNCLCGCVYIRYVYMYINLKTPFAILHYPEYLI